MFNKHMEKHSLLIIREMQLKNTVRYHFTPTRMTEVKKTIKYGSPSSIAGGNVKCVSTLKNNLTIP